MCVTWSLLNVHMYTFACALSWGMGFPEGSRMNVAAETGYLPSCVEHRLPCWGRCGCCCWQNTQFFPDTSVLMNVFWAREKPTVCLHLLLACAPTVVGHPELCPALQPGAWRVCGMACGSVRFPLHLCLHDVEWCLRGRAHSRIETRDFYFTLPSLAQSDVFSVAANYSCSSLWWSRNLTSRKRSICYRLAVEEEVS